MITSICLSDLHAGARSSLLSHVSSSAPPEAPSPVTEAVAEALQAFLTEAGATPQLILLGDQLDLQFSNRSVAFASARGFLQALWETGRLRPRILSTAGNHDHSLWTDARLGFEAETLANAEGGPVYLDATAALDRAGSTVRAPLLSALARQAGFDGADIRYPNIAFANDRRAVILHHGHFCEAPYRAMSTLLGAARQTRPAMTVGRLAAENAGWIDFLWSTFGDAAEMGEDAEVLYQRLLTSAGFRALSARWSRIAADSLGERLPMAGDREMRALLHATLRAGMDATLGRFRDTARQAEVTALGAAERLEIVEYIAEICLPQLTRELNLDDHRLAAVPQDLTFVFGHTHKPFADRLALPARAPVRVFNTGGWPLNGPRLDNAEGAALLLMDEHLNTALLRLFKTPDNGRVPLAHVEMPGAEDSDEARRFRDDIETCLAATRPQWERLADVAGLEYRARQKMLLDLTARTFAAAAREAAE